MRNTDRYMGIAVLVLCGVLFADTFTFRKTEWELLSMAFWPRLLLLILAGLAIYLIAKGNLEPGKQAESLAKKAFLAAAGGFAYVLLLKPVGFLILTPIFIWVFSYWISRRDWPWRLLESGITAMVGTFAIYGLFVLGLKLILPSGLLGD